MKILIAEDDNISRRILSNFLNKWDFKVIETSDGNQAWEAMQVEDSPKLAVLDWMMPFIDGVELCRKIRGEEKLKSMYVILLTALERKENVIEGLDAGANDYVTKPFDKDELHARIKVGQRVIELQDELDAKVKELQEALSQVKTLSGFIPICCHCKKVRDDKEYWHKVENYIEDRSTAQFSHSICPECMEKYYPDPDKDKDEES